MTRTRYGAPPSALCPPSLATVCSPPFALGVARATIARTVPCDTSAALAISRCESPSRPARLIACSYSSSASRLRFAAREPA
jgi:hypothetical protein